MPSPIKLARINLTPWELSLLVLIAASLLAGKLFSENFLTSSNLGTSISSTVIVALMIVPMTWLIIAGEIDLSVASIFGLSAVTLAYSLEKGFSFWFSLVVALTVAGLAGFINGLLVVKLSLPSLVVTIGTLGLFRGLAYILLEYRSFSDFPTYFTDFSQNNFGSSPFAYTSLPCAIGILISAIYLSKGVIGRRIYAIGSNQAVSLFSAIRTGRIRIGLFVFSGLVSGVAGILFAGYTNSARANNGAGLELSIIAIVLIGGVSMYGGQGSFLGVLLAYILVTALTSLMNLFYVSSSIQYTLIGGLMIASVAIPKILSKR
jgi:rhamnose transport system permease protein